MTRKYVLYDRSNNQLLTTAVFPTCQSAGDEIDPRCDDIYVAPIDIPDEPETQDQENNKCPIS